MKRAGLFLLFLVLLLVVAAVGAWWYLYGPNEMAADELVPSDTVALLSIPNATEIAVGYRTSQLKTVLENPNMKPLLGAVAGLLGKKNVDLLYDFAPNLSGESFVAVTRFDYDHPERVGLIAAMKPKAGLGNFDAFVEKFKDAYPDLLKQGRTGTGQVEGVDYEWIQGPGAPDKICVAQVRGWIVTSWGEAPLADWLQRFRGKAATPNLAGDPDYRRSMEAIGKSPMAVGYVSYHMLAEIAQKRMAGPQPMAGSDLVRRFGTFGGAALGTRFEKGEIADRLSILVPRPDQLELGLGADPCPFETLRFTGPDTLFYAASSINWKQYFHTVEGEAALPENANSPLNEYLTNLRDWTQSHGLDLQRNVVDPLGPELSVQIDWPENSTYPEAALLIKLDHPDQFQPVIAAILDTAQKSNATTATIKEFEFRGQKFASLRYNSPGVFIPTMAANGNYLSVYSNDDFARRSVSRHPSDTLDHNANFTRQIGTMRSAAAQIFFLDSPYLLDRSYRTAMPYLPFAEMFNKDVARLVGSYQLPDDLTWLAPIGTWTCAVTPNDTGLQIYSTSGIGNQGIFLGAALGGGLTFLQAMGYLPKQAPKLAPAASSPIPPSTNSNSNATSPSPPAPY